MHVELHPSPEIVLPSSHCSGGKTRPSPHTPVQPPSPLHLGSRVHVGEQPSYGMRLPSSHCSKPSLWPSPHVVAWQTEFGTVLRTAHANPGSRRHDALQPSSGVVLPSSHCSLPLMTPSPQTATGAASSHASASHPPSDAAASGAAVSGITTRLGASSLVPTVASPSTVAGGSSVASAVSGGTYSEPAGFAHSRIAIALPSSPRRTWRALQTNRPIDDEPPRPSEDARAPDDPS